MDEYSANIYLFTNSHTTIGRRFDISVYNNLAYAIGNDTTRPRILDGSNVTNNFGIHLTVLESEIGIGRHDATAELEIVGIAERLCLDDLAVYECQSIGIPSEIFTIEDGIDDRDIVRIPESVLGVEHRISDLHILAILERIVAIEAEIGNFDILAMHEKIVALVDLDILELDILAVPESLGSVEELGAVEGHAIHLTEHLGSLDDGIGHDEIARVPQSGSSALGEMAIGDGEAVGAPERILALETAVDSLDIACLLERALTSMDGDILETKVS